jgi:polysaccharide export outer membrane protein
MTTKRILAAVFILGIFAGLGRASVADVGRAFRPAVAAGSSDPAVQAKPQTKTPPATKPPVKAAPAPVPQAPAVPPPPGYVIGPDDVLQVLFRYDRDLTTDVVVRPDGMISLPMLSDVPAAGLTPEQLRDKVTESAKRFIEDPAVTVIVRTINSRRVFITGEVTRPGPYPLTSTMSVMQLIAIAGGLTEFADEKGISVMRTENGKPLRLPFNYKDVAKGKNLKQNIELKPGDTVIVP